MSSAASSVYNCIELRENILDLLDSRGSLARILETHREAMRGVAARLYKNIHISVTLKMDRRNARRAIYCDSVRTIDASPRPPFEPAAPSRRPLGIPPRARALPPPKLFDPIAFRKLLDLWKDKFPRLQTISHFYTQQPYDDAWVGHLKDGTVILHIQSRVGVNTSCVAPPSTPSAPNLNWHNLPLLVLPPLPKHDGFEIHHTISLHLIGEVWRADYYTEWGDYLFRNADLDRRIVYIDQSGHAGGNLLAMPDEIIPFLERRKSADHPPLSGFQFSPSTIYSPESFHELIDIIGPGLRVLHIDHANLRSMGDPRSTLALLDHSFPHLEELYLRLSTSLGLYPDVLSGLRNLRKISVRFHRKLEHRRIARLLCGLGSADCVFLAPDLESSDEMKVFDRMVRVERALLA